MDKAEILKLREFLRRSFDAPTLQVTPNSKSAEAADVSIGERKLGTITVDDEDGDRSFAFAMNVPVGRPVLQDYIRRLFENDKLTIAGRLKKTDSVELNNGPDFLGVISANVIARRKRRGDPGRKALYVLLDCFASLAMTDPIRIQIILL
jgi:hypothetical protein